MIALSSTKSKSKSKYSHLLEENRRQTEGDQKKKGKYARLYEEEEEKQERVNSADCNLPYDTDQ